MRASGAKVHELVEWLYRYHPEDLAVDQYLGEAFLLPSPKIHTLITWDQATELPPTPEVMERRVGRLIDERRSRWETKAFPELMRLRDYLSFLDLAKRTNCDIYVCGANPRSGALIGNPAYRCYGGGAFVVSRESEPNAGAIAADPEDRRLLAGLAKYAPPMSYEGYVDLLRLHGFHVLGPEEGFVLQDSEGYRLFEPYRLHGVYDRASHASAWQGREGERMRHIFNLSLGSELVRFGPQDDWECRNDREIAGPLWGPQPPVIQFQPNGQIENHVDLRDIATAFPYIRIWTRLYPHHPVDDAGGAR
jgi:hypothetical protein